jgi:hypothetical protein
MDVVEAVLHRRMRLAKLDGLQQHRGPVVDGGPANLAGVHRVAERPVEHRAQTRQ